MEMNKLENLLEKYRNIINSSYLKYNFIIEFHNIFDGIYKLDITLKEKKTKNFKYPLKNYVSKNAKQVKRPYFLTSNILYFLISDEFNVDIDLLLIKKTDNESSIFNGLIINLDKYEIICHPFKSKLISKNCNIKKFNMDEISYEYDIYKLYDGINISLYYYNKMWNISGFNKININNICYDNNNSKLLTKFNEIILKYIICNKINININNTSSNTIYKYNTKVNNYYYNSNSESDVDSYLSTSSDSDVNSDLEYNNILKTLDKHELLNNFYSKLDKKYTYNFVLINKNYNLCNKNDKIKFINKINNNETSYRDILFNKIAIKKINDINANVKNGLILVSKNGNEDRIIYYNNYYNLNKYLYSHIKKNIFDINLIILRNIIIHKINKNIFNEVFVGYKYKNIYNTIIKKLDILVDYLYDYIIKYNFPKLDLLKSEQNEEEKIKSNFIEVIIKFIKNNKYLNDILFINSDNELEITNFKENYYHNKVLYKSMIKDYIFNKDIINDLYLYIF